MFNKQGEQVILFKPTAPYLVKPEMETILNWTNKQLKTGEVHPLLVVANFIFEFLAIHPFKDGNGRMSRALTNLLLLKIGYEYIPYVSLDEIIEETKTDYYLALRATQKNHKTNHQDITPWVKYFLEVLLVQANRARKIIEEDQPEKLLSKKQLEVYHLFAKGKTLSVADINTLLRGKMPQPTIKQALSRLVKSQLLERIGQARSSRYRKI